MSEVPDPRFLLANERTFLAWVRTSLAIGAAGLGIAGLAPATDPKWVRPVIALAVTAFSLGVLGWAVKRYRVVESALLDGNPLPQLRHALWVAGGLAVVLVVSVIALLTST